MNCPPGTIGRALCLLACITFVLAFFDVGHNLVALGLAFFAAGHLV